MFRYGLHNSLIFIFETSKLGHLYSSFVHHVDLN